MGGAALVFEPADAEDVAMVAFRDDRVQPTAFVEGRSAPDLQTQMEDILNTVWEAERWARLDDRIELALRLEGRRRSGTAPPFGG